MRDGLTGLITERARWLSLDDLEPRAHTAARHCLLDWFGVALAGAQEPITEALARVVGDAPGPVPLVGRRERVGGLGAALVNGASSHALDFDDMHPLMSGHPSAAIIPALLAAAHDDGASGADLITALVAGVEVACLMGETMNPSHYEAGWHATGTLGTFAAAAATVHLLRGDDASLHRALSLAATQAAGLKAMFGTMAKPLHAGKAASNGLLAARLALAGVTARPVPLTGPGSFAALYADTNGWHPPAERALAIEGVLFKYHVSCIATHASIDNALSLRRTHAVDPRDVHDVEVRVAPELQTVCNIASPETGLEAKFSLRATTALALLGEDMGDPATFEDVTIRRPELVALRDRIRVVLDPTVAGHPTWAAMRLRTTAGTEMATETDVGGPEQNLALREERLVEKFHTLAARRLPPAAADELAAAVLAVEQLDDVRRLEALYSVV
jgi:2-methylcitrate dehydratase PrpD